jgi:transposase
MAMTIVEPARSVIGGVDTHADVHVAAAVDELGRLLGTRSFPTTPAGYRRLVTWLESFGPVVKVGIEGTGSYGAGLCRLVTAGGIDVVEVDCPNRQDRHRDGKSDTVDAVSAAQSALSGQAAGRPKGGTGPVEAMRVLLVERRSARGERTRTINQMRHLLYTGPDPLRARFSGLNPSQLTRQATQLRPRDTNQVTYITQLTVRELGRRAVALDEEVDRIDELLGPIVAAHAPGLLARPGCGLVVTATLAVAAGDRPERIRSEAAWAKLCGAAPIPAGSGKTNGRHRLNRGGNRQANAALHRIVLTRMSCHEPTRLYVARRRDDGDNTLEIMRSLKRYVARETYKYLPRRTA